MYFVELNSDTNPQTIFAYGVFTPIIRVFLSDLRPGRFYLCGRIRGMFLEVLLEHLSEFVSFGIVGGRIFPRLARLKNFRRNAGACVRDTDTKDGIRLPRRLFQSSS